jgi:hypothetical protein
LLYHFRCSSALRAALVFCLKGLLLPTRLWTFTLGKVSIWSVKYLLMNKIKIEFSPLDPKVINLVKGIELTHSFTCGFEEAPSRSASKFQIASVFFIFLCSKNAYAIRWYCVRLQSSVVESHRCLITLHLNLSFIALYVLQTRSISGSDLILKAFIFINSLDCYVQVDSGDITTIIFLRFGLSVDIFFATNVEPDKKMLLEGNSKLNFFNGLCVSLGWHKRNEKVNLMKKQLPMHNSWLTKVKDKQ